MAGSTMNIVLVRAHDTSYKAMMAFHTSWHLMQVKKLCGLLEQQQEK